MVELHDNNMYLSSFMTDKNVDYQHATIHHLLHYKPMKSLQGKGITEDIF